jgi:iron-sulfur cluster assembly accessory protein
MGEAAVTDVIAVSDKAARKIAQLAAKEGRADAVLRLRVVAGGCSGFSYRLLFEDAAAPDDAVISAGNVHVVVDPASAPIVRGSTLDLDEDLMSGGLRVRNPQAVHECSCGESFSL